jgi:hypothetical protein
MINNILSRLLKMYREFSTSRRVDSNSQMCNFWVDPTVEILVGSDELNALQDEFGIEIGSDTALDLYNMELKDAAISIEKMIREQSCTTYSSDAFLTHITPENAKRILVEIWKDSFKARSYITAAIEKIDFEDGKATINKNI